MLASNQLDLSRSGQLSRLHLNCQLGILEESEALLGGSLVFYLVNSFFDEAQHVVDVVDRDKVCLLEVVEEHGVEDLHEEIKMFWLARDTCLAHLD